MFLTREESLYLSALACSSKIVVFVFSEHVDRQSWSRNGNISMIIVKISEYIDDHGQNIGNLSAEPSDTSIKSYFQTQKWKGKFTIFSISNKSRFKHNLG